MGGNFQELLPTRPSNPVVYNSWQTDYCVPIYSDDKMLRKFAGYDGEKYSSGMPNLPQIHIALVFVDGKLLNRIQRDHGFLMGL